MTLRYNIANVADLHGYEKDKSLHIKSSLNHWNCITLLYFWLFIWKLETVHDNDELYYFINNLLMRWVLMYLETVLIMALKHVVFWWHFLLSSLLSLCYGQSRWSLLTVPLVFFPASFNFFYSCLSVTMYSSMRWVTMCYCFNERIRLRTLA
jgi:hypothetical protein